MKTIRNLSLGMIIMATVVALGGCASMQNVDDMRGSPSKGYAVFSLERENYSGVFIQNYFRSGGVCIMKSVNGRYKPLGNVYYGTGGQPCSALKVAAAPGDEIFYYLCRNNSDVKYLPIEVKIEENKTTPVRIILSEYKYTGGTVNRKVRFDIGAPGAAENTADAQPAAGSEPPKIGGEKTTADDASTRGRGKKARGH